jgi:small subunit ribosomal protein S16
MVRIRLRRVGKRKQPVYRVVVADSHSPRDGAFIEIIGQYKPLSNPSEITIDTEKALDWLRKGARPSDSVTALLKRAGIWSTYVADKGPAPKRPKRRAAPAAPPKAEAPVPAESSATEEAPEAEGPATTAEAKPEPETGDAT